MEIIEILRKIGLSKHESVVYRSLLERGPMNISDICKTAGAHRPAVYKAIAALKIKSLVSQSVRGKRNFYSAESPTKLEGDINTLTNSLKSAIKILDEVFQKQGKRPVIRFFEEKIGLTSVYDDIVDSLGRGDVFYRYSSRNTLLTDGEKYISSHYKKIRDEKHLERLVITNEQVFQEKTPRLERDVKVIPPEFDPFNYNITQIIYGNKTALIDNNTETALVIENEKIAKFFEKLFKLFYSKL